MLLQDYQAVYVCVCFYIFLYIFIRVEIKGCVRALMWMRQYVFVSLYMFALLFLSVHSVPLLCAFLQY